MFLFGCHQKFCNSQASLRNQRPQRTTRDLRVIRNREGRENAGPSQYNMTATLTSDLPAQVFERANNFSRSKQRERWHQTNTSTSRVVTVGGMPSSARTARHARIASATFDSASASVCPWLTQPGIAGHSAIYAPSSSW